MASLTFLFFFFFFFFFFVSFASSLHFVSSEPSICPSQPPNQFLLNNLQSQCPPLSIAPSSAIEVDGASLDRALSSSNGNVYTVILFYTSWCPFSHGARSTFDVLNSMFPQIVHLAVEQSSAMPSIFSRYGIHSVPSLLMVNQTAKVRYHGPKDLDSLLHFYKSLTGHRPIAYFTDGQPRRLGISEKPLFGLSGGITKELLVKEPYLVLATLFLILRAFLYLYPGILSRLRDIWVFYIPHLNLGIFGETSQLVGRILHLIDVKRVWGKMGWCKIRNFQQGAKNARVWASSLASVSLGESSSVRSSLAGDS